MPAKVAKEIEKLDGVAATCAGLVDFQTVEEFGSEPVGIQGWPAGNYMFRELKIIDGENLSDRDPGSKGIVVGNTLATVKSLKVGQTLTISDEKFHIVGIFESTQDIENGMIVMLLDDAQKVLGKNDMMTGCTVKVKDTSDGRHRRRSRPNRGPGCGALRLDGQDPCQAAGRVREAEQPGPYASRRLPG